MKYLLKKADHDIINRDSAIVYAGGKFYLGGTHSICLKKIKDDNPEIKTVLKSFFRRADVEQFQEISKHVGTVILAHLAKKEDGVFIDFGIIDGEYKDYDNIPDKYKKEFENEFGMKTYDEMKHDVDVYKNPELNPYSKEEEQELKRKFDEEFKKLTDPSEAQEFLKQQGYEKDGKYWISEDRTIAVLFWGEILKIIPIGEKEQDCQLDGIAEKLPTVKPVVLDTFRQYNPKKLEYNYDGNNASISFENNNGVNVEINLKSFRNYKITSPTELKEEILDDLNVNTISEYIEFIMNWSPEGSSANGLQNLSQVKEYLSSQGYTEGRSYWIDETQTIAVGISGRNRLEIVPIGEKPIVCKIEDFVDTLNNVQGTALDKIQQHNPIDFTYYFRNSDFFAEFENNHGIKITLILSEYDRYVIRQPRELSKGLPTNFCYDTIDECMEYIMDWTEEKEKARSEAGIENAKTILDNELAATTTNAYEIQFSYFEEYEDNFVFRVVEYDQNGNVFGQYTARVNANNGKISYNKVN